MIRPVLRIGVLVALAIGSIGQASAADPVWMIIGATEKTQPDAARRMAALAERGHARWTILRGGYPRVFRSDKVSGLKPGYWVVALGACDSHDEAKRARARILHDTPVYVRKVRGVAVGCPQPRAVATTVPAGTEVQQTVKLRSSGNLRVERLVVEQTNEKELCNATSTIFRLADDAGVMDEKVLRGRCDGACTEEEVAEGEATVAEIEKDIEAGGSESQLDYNFTQCDELGHGVDVVLEELDRPVLVIYEQSYGPHSTIMHTSMLLGMGCGALQISETFLNDQRPPHNQTFEAAVVVSSRPSAKGSWQDFRLDTAELLSDRKPAPMVTVLKARFDDAACRWLIE